MRILFDRCLIWSYFQSIVYNFHFHFNSVCLHLRNNSLFKTNSTYFNNNYSNKGHNSFFNLKFKKNLNWWNLALKRRFRFTKRIDLILDVSKYGTIHWQKNSSGIMRRLVIFMREIRTSCQYLRENCVFYHRILNSNL